MEKEEEEKEEEEEEKEKEEKAAAAAAAAAAVVVVAANGKEEAAHSRREHILRTPDMEAAQEDSKLGFWRHSTTSSSSSSTGGQPCWDFERGNASVPHGKEEAEVWEGASGGGGRTPPTCGRDAQGEGVPYFKAGRSISLPYMESECAGAEDAGSWKRTEDWEGQVDVFFKREKSLCYVAKREKSLCYVAVLLCWANRNTNRKTGVCSRYVCL